MTRYTSSGVMIIYGTDNLIHNNCLITIHNYSKGVLRLKSLKAIFYLLKNYSNNPKPSMKNTKNSKKIFNR